MRKHHPENELAKRDYLAWLRNTEGRHETSIDATVAAIHAFEAFNRYASFKTFRPEQAISFKAHLSGQTNAATGKPLSKSTLRSRLMALRAFFEWLSREPGYRKAIRFHDAAYFNLLANDARVASAAREQPYPSLAQVTHVLEQMPTDTAVERRDRAVIAYIILTGARDSAVASMRLKHVDLATGQVFQDAREVRTKRAKTFTSVFFRVGELPRRIVADWIVELESQHVFGPNDPIFPATERSFDENGLFQSTSLTREAWSSAGPIREVFRKAFTAAGLPYYPPHRLRRTLMKQAYDLKLSPRELKAWSESLGHDSLATSIGSYGSLNLEERCAAMAGIRDSAAREDDDGLAKRIAALIADHRAG